MAAGKEASGSPRRRGAQSPGSWARVSVGAAALVGVGALVIVALGLARGVAGTTIAASCLVLVVTASAVAAVAVRGAAPRDVAGSGGGAAGLGSDAQVSTAPSDTEAASALHRLHSLFDGSPVGLTLSDERGYFVEVNEAFCRLVGRPRELLIGRSAAGFTHVDDLFIVEHSGDLIATSSEGFVRLEKRYVLPDGSIRWVWLSLTHVPGPDNETWTLAHAQDITERKSAEQEVAQSRMTLQAARDIARATQIGDDPRPILLDRLLHLADASSVQFLEPGEPGTLRVTAAAGEQDLTGLVINLDEVSVSAHVWQTGETVFASRAAEHPMVHRELLERSKASSAMWAPVGVVSEMRAVLALTWNTKRDPVTSLQTVAVESLAAETAVALLGERMRQQLERASLTDPLTGLWNRRGWEQRSAAMRRRMQEQNQPLTIALLDLDRFKQFNDRHGHPAGDQALSTFAAGLRRQKRSEDLAARWGGEEFIVALPGCDLDQAQTVLDRLRACAPSGLTCSIGCTQAEPDEPLASAITRADQALYVAKRTGRDKTCRS